MWTSIQKKNLLEKLWRTDNLMLDMANIMHLLNVGRVTYILHIIQNNRILFNEIEP